MLNRNKLRAILLSNCIIREILFFIYQKKVYKGFIDKKITTLINGKQKLSIKRTSNLIVSLTSFPQRINEIKYTIFSLLDQTILPEKIILWLEESKFPNKEQDLPEELLALKKYGFAIYWCEDLRSYGKLIPALEQFQDYYIVTVDDDIYYKKNLLERLWLEHLKYPDDVICNLGAKISFKNNKVMPYTRWKRYIKKREAGFQILGCGYGGSLYHKRYLHKDINRRDLFLNLTPYADDIWFYFMTILNGTKVRVVKHPLNRIKYVNPYREYGLNHGHTLSSINVDSGKNDEQFKNVINHYGIDIYKLTEKHE
jgi:hypothetical protein